jgi:hypothetical protein
MVGDVFVFHDSGSAQSTVGTQPACPALGRTTSILKTPLWARPDSGRLLATGLGRNGKRARRP